LGYEIKANSLQIILPVGISFYTFQTLSYTIDVYRKKLNPTHDYIAFSAFVSFFPQLVAGPIERATNLLPQFYKERKFDYYQATDGLRQILWGLFKKIVIADNCAEYVNYIFGNSSNLPGSTLFIGAIFFAFQIYGDFSGYSDIAIGTARLFGFNLMRNFAFPYFSRDIAEFWRRWHISLSTWFRDYLYIPLGGSRGNLGMKIRNTLIIFVVSGFWHGANWTFVIWGALNAVYFLPLLLSKNNRKNLDIIAENSILPRLKDLSLLLFTFLQTTFAWIFFRAENIGHAKDYLAEIFSKSLFEKAIFPSLEKPTVLWILIILFLWFEWIGRRNEYALEKIGKHWNRYFRWFLYVFIIFIIGMFMPTTETPFIYFQF
jgi:alginate O-acetyltransferase complex protein AlgI